MSDDRAPRARDDDAGALDVAGVPTPTGVRLRRATLADVDAVAELYADCAEDRIGERLWERDDIAARWRDTSRLDDTLLIEDQDGRLLAFGEFHADRDPWSDDVDLYLDARVHPTATGHGLGTFLLARAEARALALSAGEPLLLRTTLVDADDRGRALFHRLGFRPVRHFLDLRMDLSDPPPPPAWPSGVAGRRPDLPGDLEAVWAAHQLAFADHWNFHPVPFDEWRYLVVERPEDDGAMWRVAEDDQGIVGVAIVRASMPEDPGMGYVRDLGVIPRARRQGVAQALLRSVFAGLRSAGVRRVGLEVDDLTMHGAVRLYEAAGMRVARRTDVYQKVPVG